MLRKQDNAIISYFFSRNSKLLKRAVPCQGRKSTLTLCNFYLDNWFDKLTEKI